MSEQYENSNPSWLDVSVDELTKEINKKIIEELYELSDKKREEERQRKLKKRENIINKINNL